MGKRGPKPKPAQAHVLAGTFREDRHGGAHPQPKRGRPRRPAWLDGTAKAKWKQLAPELDRLGLLTVVDGDALAAYCLAWAELVVATQTLQREGRTQTSTVTGTSKAHPAVNMQRTAWQAIRQFAALFGLNPSSRSSLDAPPAPTKPDLLDELLNATNGAAPGSVSAFARQRGGENANGKSRFFAT